MTTTEIEIPSRAEYERMAYEYMASLPLEHHMEGNYNAIQRKITVESFDLISARRPDVQVCNELLVQYPHPSGRTGQVVPDNMVVILDRPIGGDMSFNAAIYELSSIFMVLEYVSKGRQNQRKEYEINRLRYESELQVPYYMLFDPDTKKLTLLHLEGSTYDDVKPNATGRLPIPELDLEIAVLDGWVRFWHHGELVPLPVEIQSELDSVRNRADREERRADHAEPQVQREKQRAEQEKQRAEQEKLRADLEVEKTRKLAEKLRSLGIDPNS